MEPCSISLTGISKAPPSLKLLLSRISPLNRMKLILAFLTIILCSLNAFGQGAQYRPTPFANGFVQTVTSTGTAQTYLGIGSATNTALLNGTNNFTGANSFVSLTYSPALLGYEAGSNIVVDATRTLSYVTLTNTTHFAAASNFSHGASVIIVVKQDATGGRSVTFDTNFWKFPGGFAPSITTNANAIDVLSAVASPFSTNFLSVQTPNLQ